MKDIKGFIFDLDGVITDTAEYHFLAWKHLADEKGIPFSREDNEKLRGISRLSSIEIILGENLKDYSETQIEAMMERKNTYYKEFLEKITPDDYLPGVIELLDKLKEKNYRIALASSSKNTRTVVNKLNATKKFDVILDGYSVKKAKPAPDLFLEAAEQLGLKPEECIVIEDAESGIEAALAGNFTVIGIGPAERTGKAHFRYDTVAEINLDEVLGRLLEI